MTRKLNAFLLAAQVKRVCIVLDDFFTLMKSMMHTEGVSEEHVFSHPVLNSCTLSTCFTSTWGRCSTFSRLATWRWINANFTLLNEGDVGQVRSILWVGHLAVNKCNFTLFRREMLGRCAPFFGLATWLSINAILIYSGGRCGVGALHSPGWPPGGQ